jgi:diguanylate cyclase (GGDEF)-like protein
VAKSDESAQRRTDDGQWHSRLGGLLARFVKQTSDGADPVPLGCVLLLATAVIVTCSVPMLDAAADAWLQAAEVVGLILLPGILAARFVPWQRLGRRATLVFPLLVCAGLVVLSAQDTSSYAALTGLLSLCFAYIGLTQPPRTALAGLPVAAATFVFANGEWSGPVLIRLTIGMWVWAILGEVLSRFTARQAALSDALRIAAHTDALTGVANRRDFELRLAVAAPGDAIVICDLDHFKRLNDTLGHRAGDIVLAEFGSMLRATLRGCDFAARYGGEEFVLVLPATDLAAAEATLARMREHWSVLQPTVTFSAGLANCAARRSHAETLAVADRGLYAAKAAGRNCSVPETALAERPAGLAVQA